MFRPGSRCLAWCFVERRHGIHYKFNVFRRHISAVCVVSGSSGGLSSEGFMK